MPLLDRFGHDIPTERGAPQEGQLRSNRCDRAARQCPPPNLARRSRHQGGCDIFFLRSLCRPSAISIFLAARSLLCPCIHHSYYVRDRLVARMAHAHHGACALVRLGLPVEVLLASCRACCCTLLWGLCECYRCTSWVREVVPLGVSSTGARHRPTVESAKTKTMACSLKGDMGIR